MNERIVDGAVPDPACAVRFAGPVAPAVVSRAYRFGLLLATVAMFLVPLLYLLLIVGAGWLLVWHVTTNSASRFPRRLGGAAFA